jgi:hypothetical protein
MTFRELDRNVHAQYSFKFYGPFGGCPFNPPIPLPPLVHDCQYNGGPNLMFDLTSLYYEDVGKCGQLLVQLASNSTDTLRRSTLTHTR